MEHTELKNEVYSIFSDTNMVILALIALPITIVELLTPSGSLILTVLDWTIWFIFLLEFALKVYVEGDATTYMNNNKADSALSIIIVASPVLAIVSGNLIPFPALGIARALRIFRVLGYGDSAYVKKREKQIKEKKLKMDERLLP